MDLYDDIGRGYRNLRVPDARVGARILDALGDSASILNVGAGTGSYEELGRELIAVEPSRVMLEQRSADAAPVVRARAEALPFASDSFDAALGILTIHHWTDLEAGLAEMRRVARDRVVLLTIDHLNSPFWLMTYFPEISEIDLRILPPLPVLTDLLSASHVEEIPVPRDCTDGFLGAYWGRPESYLDADVRFSISTFAKIDRLEEGLASLRTDLDTGRWDELYGHLRTQSELDVGYRLVIGPA